MRLVLQRVSSASVTVAGEVIGEIGRGLLILVAATHGDTQTEANWLAQKAANLRIFEDDQGKMNRSVLDIGGAVLVVSQFTLYGDARKGRRPSFIKAALPPVAAPLVEYFANQVAALGLHVVQGRFGADMKVALVNDGPVTIILERDVPAAG